jgi:hypothetical protein
LQVKPPLWSGISLESLKRNTNVCLQWTKFLFYPYIVACITAKEYINSSLQQPLVLKFTHWISPPTVERFVSTAGTLLDKRSLVALGMDTSKCYCLKRQWSFC